MVRLASILSLLCLAYSGTSQVLDTAFNGYLSPFVITSGSAPTWVTTGRFINENKSFTGAELSKDSKIIVESGGKCYTLTINTITATSPNIVTTVTDSSGTLTTLPRDAIIARPDSNGIYPYVAGAPDRLQSCIQTSNWLKTTGAIGISGTYNVTDTTITATSYTATLSNQEERILSDITSIGNNATITLPDPTSHLGKKVSVKQINPTGGFATQVTVNAIGNRIRLPGQTALTNVVNIPAGTENEYILSPAYDDNSAVYIWSVTEPNAVYSESDGVKFYDPVTSVEQKVKVNYEVNSTSEILDLKAADGTLIRNSDNTTWKVQSDTITGLPVDSLSVIPITSSKYAVVITDDIANARDFGITGVLADTSKIRKFLTYCKVTGKGAYFPIGTYQFPEDFEFDFGSTDMILIGDGIGKTIFTTAGSVDFRYTKKINVTQPIVEDGVYQVDVIGNLHNDYSSVLGSNIPLDTFVLIEGGAAVKMFPRDSAINRGYIAGLDYSGTEPTAEGLYVVDTFDSNWGGGFAHQALAWEGTCYVIVGSIVKNTGGTWTRYNPGNGFVFREDGRVEGIEFREFAPFCLSPLGQNSDKQFNLENCRFENVARVIGLEESGGGSGALLPGYNHRPGGAGGSKFRGYSFKSFRIHNCEFDYVLSSINWNVLTRKYTVTSNVVTNAYTPIALFQSTSPAVDSIYTDDLGSIIENNKFIDFRNYSGANAVNRECVKIGGPAKVANNTFLRCNGIGLFVSGSGNIISGNTFYPFSQQYISQQIFLKGNGVNTTSDLISDNNIVGGLNVIPIGLQKSSGLKISNNVIKTAGATKYFTTSVSSEDVSQYSSYVILDSLRFITIAESRNQIVSSFTVGATRYFNYRTSSWEALPSISIWYGAVANVAVDTVFGSINIEGNTIEHRYFFSNNNFNISTLRIFGNTFADGILFGSGIDDVDQCIVASNEFIITTSGDKVEPKRLVWDNNRTFVSPIGSITIEPDTLISMSNNLWSGDFYRRPSGFYGLSSPVAFGSVSINIPNAIIKNNEFHAYSARTNAMNVGSLCENIVLDNCKFIAKCDQTVYGNRVAISSSMLGKLAIKNCYYQFDSTSTRNFLEQSVDLDTLVLKNNSVIINPDATRFIEASGVTIGVLLKDDIQAPLTNATITKLTLTPENYNTVTSTSSPQTLWTGDNLISQGGTQASFTLVLPANPTDGDIVTITAENEITALTIDGNSITVLGAPVTLLAGERIAFKYFDTVSKWINIQ